MRIGIFFSHPFNLAGTETWIRNIARVYHDKYDITVYYSASAQEAYGAPSESFDFLMSMVKCVPLEPEDPVEVDIALFAYEYFHIDWVKADKKYLFIHPGNGHGNHPRKLEDYAQFTDVIAVSEYTKNKMAKWCPGLECKVIYNPVPPQKLRFISLSRTGKEKGWRRMKQLCTAMIERGIDFEWDIYTDFPTIKNKGFTPKKPTINAIDRIREADFLVQLSDHESFGYSMVEGLQYAKLVITDIEILPEMGVTKDNAVIVPLKNPDWNAVIDDILSRTYTPPQTDYSVIFGEPSNPDIVRVKNVSSADLYLHGQSRWVEVSKTETVDNDEEVKELISKGILQQWK